MLKLLFLSVYFVFSCREVKKYFTTPRKSSLLLDTFRFSFLFVSMVLCIIFAYMEISEVIF